MELNKVKFNKKFLTQIFLILFAILIIFLTYFSKKTEDKISKEIQGLEEKEVDASDENKNIFDDVTYENFDANGNKFIINADYAEYESDKSNIIYMKKIVCKFFFKDGTILKILSDKGIYDNISNDMEFEEQVEMYYLENVLFAEKAIYSNSESFLVVEDNVRGSSPQGKVASDKLDFDLVEKKLKISMYNEDKVNIKLNY